MADEVKGDKKALQKYIGKRLAARVLRTWVEDFVDEDTVRLFQSNVMK
jgi:DNA-directed RNA polymerase subunit beta